MNNPVLLYDGECNFCRSIVHWIAERDREDTLRFAALQSEPGQQLLAQHGISPTYRESAVLFEDGRSYLGAEAVFRTLEYLRAPWRSSRYATKVIPKVFREWGYRRVSNNRSILSRMFGTINHKWEPAPQLKHRFLDYPYEDRGSSGTYTSG